MKVAAVFGIIRASLLANLCMATLLDTTSIAVALYFKWRKDFLRQIGYKL